MLGRTMRISRNESDSKSKSDAMVISPSTKDLSPNNDTGKVLFCTKFKYLMFVAMTMKLMRFLLQKNEFRN